MHSSRKTTAPGSKTLVCSTSAQAHTAASCNGPCMLLLCGLRLVWAPGDCTQTPGPHLLPALCGAIAFAPCSASSICIGSTHVRAYKAPIKCNVLEQRNCVAIWPAAHQRDCALCIIVSPGPAETMQVSVLLCLLMCNIVSNRVSWAVTATTVVHNEWA